MGIEGGRGMTNSISLFTLKELFPKTAKNCALTGPIPLLFFEVYESEIRKLGVRIFYRGPRPLNKYGRKSNTTRRADANFVVLYTR